MAFYLKKMLLLFILTVILAGCDANKKSPTQELAEYKYQIPELVDDGWQTSSIESAGVNIEKLAKLMTQILNGQHSQIDGVLIIKQNQLVLEEYFNGYHRTKRHELQSAVKSIDSALVGLAIQQGYLTDVQQPIYDSLPEFHDLDWSNGKDQISIKDLLTMRSGMPCQDGTQGDCNSQKLNQQSSWARYTLQQNLTSPPGELFSYFTGLPVLSHTIIENLTGMSLDDFSAQFLLQPLGITDFIWGHSPSGEALSGEMLPRDMAKFGQLYLDLGMWHGQQIINSQWVTDSVYPHVASPQANGGGYGYWWWLSESYNGKYRITAALGAKDQCIFVLPELQAVVVFTGNKDTGEAYQLLNSYIIPAIE